MVNKRTPRRGSSPRVSKGVEPRSALREKRWAVIADHYFSNNLTYDEARAEAESLKAKKQPGVVIATNEAAQRMMQNVGVGVPALPDMKF